jgi:hypothetical protein
VGTALASFPGASVLNQVAGGPKHAVGARQPGNPVPSRLTPLACSLLPGPGVDAALQAVPPALSPPARLPTAEQDLPIKFATSASKVAARAKAALESSGEYDSQAAHAPQAVEKDKHARRKGRELGALQGGTHGVTHGAAAAGASGAADASAVDSWPAKVAPLRWLLFAPCPFCPRVHRGSFPSLPFPSCPCPSPPAPPPFHSLGATGA